MINVIDLPLERVWRNSPVIKLVLNDTRYMAMFDSGAMIPMYVRTLFIVRKDGSVFNLYASSDENI